MRFASFVALGATWCSFVVFGDEFREDENSCDKGGNDGFDVAAGRMTDDIDVNGGKRSGAGALWRWRGAVVCGIN